MSRYIDADELLKEASKDGAYGYVSAEQIANFPTADVVKHGRWIIEYGDGHRVTSLVGGNCSRCGYFAPATRYCPNCGALMMDEVEE